MAVSGCVDDSTATPVPASRQAPTTFRLNTQVRFQATPGARTTSARAPSAGARPTFRRELLVLVGRDEIHARIDCGAPPCARRVA